MITLVLTFVACLGAEPDRCRTVEVPWDGSLMQCMLFGQHQTAAWLNENPKWQLRGGYRCETGSNA